CVREASRHGARSAYRKSIMPNVSCSVRDIEGAHVIPHVAFTGLQHLAHDVHALKLLMQGGSLFRLGWDKPSVGFFRIGTIYDRGDSVTVGKFVLPVICQNVTTGFLRATHYKCRVRQGYG